MSKIEWTEKTWNPIVGCHKFSKECDNCYAEVMHNRHIHNPQQPKYTDPFKVVKPIESELTAPYSWSNPQKVFVCSMSDLFNKRVPLEFLKKVFHVMNNTPHTYQILTKRSDRMAELAHNFTWTPNIWAGVSVGIKDAIYRIDDLRKVPANIRYISFEPLIESVKDADLTDIHWVIIGGESGQSLQKLRKTELPWVEEIIEKAEEKDVKIFFKQWGRTEFNPNPIDPTIPKKGKKGKKKTKAKHLPKGGMQVNGKEYQEFPEYEPYRGYIINSYKDEVKELHDAVVDSISTLKQSYINCGQKLIAIEEMMDSIGKSKEHWKLFFGVDSFKEYCEVKLNISRETAYQIMWAVKFIQDTKPELLDDDSMKMPDYTKIRVLKPHRDDIVKNPKKYSDIYDMVFNPETTRVKLQEKVNEYFSTPKSIEAEIVEDDDTPDISMRILQFKMDIEDYISENDRDEFQKLMDKVEKLIKIEPVNPGTQISAENGELSS